jgi:hypothetical protein
MLLSLARVGSERLEPTTDSSVCERSPGFLRRLEWRIDGVRPGRDAKFAPLQGTSRLRDRPAAAATTRSLGVGTWLRRPLPLSRHQCRPRFSAPVRAKRQAIRLGRRRCAPFPLSSALTRLYGPANFLSPKQKVVGSNPAGRTNLFRMVMEVTRGPRTGTRSALPVRMSRRTRSKTALAPDVGVDDVCAIGRRSSRRKRPWLACGPRSRRALIRRLPLCRLLCRPLSPASREAFLRSHPLSSAVFRSRPPSSASRR